MKLRAVGSGLLVVLMFLGGAVSAAADGNEDALEEILSLSPGVTVDVLKADIESIASAENLTEAEVLQEMLLGARAASRISNEGHVSPSSGGDDGLGYNVQAGCSTFGDYTYSHARNYGQNHGHNALYDTACSLIEAPGPGKNVSRVHSTKTYFSHPDYRAQKRRVSGSTQAQKQAAASFSQKQLGKPYNLKFYQNRIVNATHYNCSQLVWAAWKTAGVDISGHNRGGIYPNDLRTFSGSTLVAYMVRK